MQVCQTSPSINPGTRASAISAARIVPEPRGFVRISASPGRAPPLAITRGAIPVTVKPMVSSAPSVEWPPTMSAPASRSTRAASSMISASMRACRSGPIGGSAICARAVCGAAPIAQMSPSACRAASRAIRRASGLKPRRWSVVRTCTPPPGCASTAASSPGPDRTSGRWGGGRSASAAASMSGPSFAPQPPHRGRRARCCARPLVASLGTGGGDMAGRSASLSMKARSIRSFSRQSRGPDRARPHLSATASLAPSATSLR